MPLADLMAISSMNIIRSQDFVIIWMRLTQFYGESFYIFKCFFCGKKIHLISQTAFGHIYLSHGKGMHIHNDIPPFLPQDLGGALRAATYVGHEEVTNPTLRQVSLLRGFKATEATNTRVVSQK